MHENDPSHVGHRQRLRERFIRAGLAGFSEHEVVELLLTLVIPRRDTKPIAKALLNRFRTLRGVLDAPKSELTRVKGVGAVAWTTLRIVRDSANYYLQQRAQDTVKLTEQDKLLTRALVLAATTLQINLFDHLIVSANDVFSFRRAGLL